MKFHTDTQFYTSAFFVVMNRSSYERLPADVRDALDLFRVPPGSRSLVHTGINGINPFATAPTHPATKLSFPTRLRWRSGRRSLSP